MYFKKYCERNLEIKFNIILFKFGCIKKKKKKKDGKLKEKYKLFKKKKRKRKESYVSWIVYHGTKLVRLTLINIADSR